jgi:toxin ParE1/3/4
VPEGRLSAAAQRDLEAIFEYSIARWGEATARRYAEDIERVVAQLAESPRLGRVYDLIDPELRVFPKRSHVIYYRVRPYGVRVVRVLHGGMLPDGRLAVGDEGED